MSRIRDIADTPTTIRGWVESTDRYDTLPDVVRYKESAWHESLLRSYAILDYAQGMLEQGASAAAVLTIIKDLRALPPLSVNGSVYK